MDPLTHTLTGVVVAQILPLEVPTTTATITMAISANLPDVDAFLRRLKSTAFIEYHHGLTHSLIGMFILSGLFSLLWTPVVSAPFLTVCALSILGCLLHTAGDLLIHIYKIPLLVPFSQRRFGANIFVGLNPLTSSARCGERSLRICARCQLHSALKNPILIILASCVLLGVASGRRYHFSVVGLTLVIFYLLVVVFLRRKARMMCLAHNGIAHGWETTSINVYPASFLPFRWLCVVEENNAYHLGLVDLVRSKDPVAFTTLSKEEGSPLIEAARQTDTVRPLLEKAFHPYATAEPNEQGTLVKWKDLAYAFDPRIDLFTARVQFSPDGTVISEEFRERW